jgi:hypothetical protein
MAAFSQGPVQPPLNPIKTENRQQVTLLPVLFCQ